MSKINEIQESLMEAIDILTKEERKKLKFDYTKRGIVKSISGTDSVVEIDGEDCKCKIRNGISVAINDLVLVKIPNNNFSEKYIDAKLGEVGTGGSGEGGSYVSSDFNHNQLQNTHNLTTDIDHNQLSNYDINEHRKINDTGESNVDLWSAQKIKSELNSVSVDLEWENIQGKPTSSVVNIDDAVTKRHEHNNLTLLQTITQGLIDTWNTVTNKVDKVAGKGLSTEDYTTTEKNKLAGIENNANNYIHPENHPSSIITQDANNRFVSDVEKTTWNNKSDLILGETSTTAYRGDRGKTGYDHSQIVSGNPHGTNKSDIGLENVDNTSDATKNVLSATKLTTARTINGVSFDGTANIVVADSTKVVANPAITSATKTKITYDAKGLVTSGTDATTADIVDSLNKRYVTDAEKVVIGNTSGTNSGNETTATIGSLINTATAKTTPVDADMFGLMDSAASNILKKLSWVNIKNTLKTYFDTLYNNYIHPTGFSNQPSTPLTNSNVISQITINNEGHVTGVSSRNLTPVNIGAEPAFTKNTAFNKNFGSVADTICQGNDSRLSDARTPLSHVHGNITNQGAIGTTANLVIQTTTSGVLTAKTAGTTSQYLRGDGAWATPPDTNTTYSAGNGISLSGTTFSVAGGNGLTQETSGLALGTPGTLNATTNNALTATSHTHEVSGFAISEVKTFNLPATVNWYRIAQGAPNQEISSALIQMEWVDSTNRKGSALFTVASEGTSICNLNQISCEYTTAIISQIRAMRHSTTSGNRSFIEVYLATAVATTVTFRMINPTGWEFLDTQEIGSLPTGYTAYPITFSNTAPFVVSSTTQCTNLNATFVGGLTSASFSRITSTSGAPNTLGWYRIASGNTTFNTGLFDIYWSLSTGGYGNLTFVATTSTLYGGKQIVDIDILSYSNVGNDSGFTELRVVYNTTNATSHIELYKPTSGNLSTFNRIINTVGWAVTSPATAGSIPGGYLTNNYILEDMKLATEKYVNDAITEAGGNPYHAGIAPPSNTSLFWIDTN